GHGTHVAGIAAGLGTASAGYYTGVAPGAKLVGLSTGDILFIFWALAAIDYILDHQQAYNIKVVNNSWGTSGPFAPKDPIIEATHGSNGTLPNSNDVNQASELNTSCTDSLANEQ